MKKAKMAIFVLAIIVAIETAHILTVHLIEIPEYVATIGELRSYLDEAWEKEMVLGEMVFKLLKEKEETWKTKPKNHGLPMPASGSERSLSTSSSGSSPQ